MKSTLRSIPVLLLFLVISAAAWSSAAKADIKQDHLVGKWSGKMTMTDGKQSQDTDVTMEFTIDGKAILSSGGGKTEETTYAIEKDAVVLKDPDKHGDDVRMINIQLTATNLSADVVLSDAEKMGKEIKVAVKLQKH